MGAFIQMSPKEVLTQLCAEYFALLNLLLQIPFAFLFPALFPLFFSPFRHLNAELATGINTFLKSLPFNSLMAYIIFLGESVFMGKPELGGWNAYKGSSPLLIARRHFRIDAGSFYSAYL